MNSNYNNSDRKEFLIEMYTQLANSIDRHIKVIWQIAGVFLSTFLVYTFVDTKVLTLDIATSILILVSGLSIAIIIESNYWCNRNLVIIANIERQFLHESDLKDIHHYFGKHRENNAYHAMMTIQIYFNSLLLMIITVYHFFIQVWPNRELSINHFDPLRCVPYLTLLISFYLLFRFNKKRIKNYNEFKTTSPGIEIDSLVNNEKSSTKEIKP